MSNISIKINLRQLKHHVSTLNGKNGKVKCLIVPLKQNYLFEGEKGIYMDMMAFELKERKANSKDTHLIKQSFPKNVYDAMSEEQRRNMPILGNAIDWSKRQFDEPEPQDTDIDVNNDQVDDLPF